MKSRANIITIIMALLIITFLLSMIISPALAKNTTIAISKDATRSSALITTAQTTKPDEAVGFNSTDACINVNDTITWINEDRFPHIVVSGDPSTGPNAEFDSGILGVGLNNTWSHLFDKKENVSYFDALNPVNPNLTGHIKVAIKCP